MSGRKAPGVPVGPGRPPRHGGAAPWRPGRAGWSSVPAADPCRADGTPADHQVRGRRSERPRGPEARRLRALPARARRPIDVIAVTAANDVDTVRAALTRASPSTSSSPSPSRRSATSSSATPPTRRASPGGGRRPRRTSTGCSVPCAPRRPRGCPRGSRATRAIGTGGRRCAEGCPQGQLDGWEAGADARVASTPTSSDVEPGSRATPLRTAASATSFATAGATSRLKALGMM